jgi:hypothetical protein
MAGAAALVAGKAATLGYTAEAFVRPHQPKYKGKAMRIRSLGYLGGLGLVPAAWWVFERDERYPVAADLAVTVPLLIDAAGNSLGIYDEARLDDLVHGFNAAVLSSLFGAVISTRMESRAKATAATLVFGVVGEILFDGMEYVAEAIGFEGLGLSREDTLADIGAASIGAVVAAAVTWVRWKPRPGAPLIGKPRIRAPRGGLARIRAAVRAGI